MRPGSRSDHLTLPPSGSSNRRRTAVRKIPTLFLRDPEDRAHVLPVVNPECQWVIDGEGIPTQKIDGTCVQLDEDNRWWARREVKPGKTPPANFLPVQTDEATGKTMGWEPIGQSAFAKYHAEALKEAQENAVDPWTPWPVGTYELIGPKINGNPERMDRHWLVAHANCATLKVPVLTFEGIRETVLRLGEGGVEGLVWHHPDGRAAKIKARDFMTKQYTATCVCDCPECAGGHGCCGGADS
jgi:hypothetical protein